MSPIEKSSKLDNVCYDIRGPVLKEAKRLEEEGNKVLKLNIGNPAPFGFEAPDEILVDVIRNLPTAQGYCDSKGLYSARKAIMQHYQARGMRDVTVEDIYIGNGVSELIVQAMQALLNSGDEMLVPAPDYPLWTAAVSLSSGKAVHYLCDESSDWFPDLDDIRAKITPRTRGIVIINPNNPTGAVFSPDTIKALSDMLCKKQAEYGTDIYIIADEPYRELSYGAEVPYIPKYYANTVICYSYSKSLSLPGERIGYIFIPEGAADCRKLYAAVCGAGRALGFVCAPSLMQYTVAECTDVLPDVSAYKKNRDLLFGALTDYGYEAVPPDGAFYLFVKSPEPDANAFCERAKKYELLLVPSADFGCEGCVRISYCVTAEQIERSLPAFKALIEEYK